MNDYYGDFTAGSVVRIKFNTLDQSLIPTAPSVGLAFAVYKNSTTESTAGLSLSTAYDGLAGFHMLTINTAADTAFYVAGQDYDIVFTAGTVDGKDLTRVKLKTFSLENRNQKPSVSAVGVHVARISVFTVDSNGNRIDKSRGAHSISTMTHTSTSILVIPDASIPNSAGYPDVKAYLEAETADGFELKHMDQSFIITAQL